MHLRDAKRAFIIYNNFVRINKEVRSMANWIMTDLKYHLKMDFYEVDVSVVKSMKSVIDLKEKKRNFDGSAKSITTESEDPSQDQESRSDANYS